MCRVFERALALHGYMHLRSACRWADLSKLAGFGGKETIRPARLDGAVDSGVAPACTRVDFFMHNCTTRFDDMFPAGAVAGRVDVVSCMVDRICTDRTITPDWIEMGTEPSSGEIVVRRCRCCFRCCYLRRCCTVTTHATRGGVGAATCSR